MCPEESVLAKARLNDCESDTVKQCVCCLSESHPNREGRMAKKRKKATAKKKTTKRKAKKKGLMAKIMGK